MYKQLIIARKDLNMTPGKLAVQVSHASMAFLINEIKQKVYQPTRLEYNANLVFNKNMYEEWINSSFTKIVCEAKNKNQLLRAIDMAHDLNLVEGIDFFLIKDNCLTELKPEEEEVEFLLVLDLNQWILLLLIKLVRNFSYINKRKMLKRTFNIVI